MRVPRSLLYSVNMDMAVRLLGGYRLLIFNQIAFWEVKGRGGRRPWTNEGFCATDALNP
jgi:hypothetical protein